MSDNPCEYKVLASRSDLLRDFTLLTFQFMDSYC